MFYSESKFKIKKIYIFFPGRGVEGWGERGRGEGRARVRDFFFFYKESKYEFFFLRGVEGEGGGG